jgi:hypothetical protein
VKPQLTIKAESPAEGGRGAIRLTLVGTIDERADLTPLRDLESASRVVLDLGGVTRINSVGVREWIRAMRAIPSSIEVVWERVAPVMVSQIAMIANFHGHSRIESFLAPYFCPECDAEQTFLLTPAEHLADGKAVAPIRDCPECGDPLVFDDIEADYLGGIIEVGRQAG